MLKKRIVRSAHSKFNIHSFKINSMRIENIHFKNIEVFDDELIEFEPTGEENQAEIHIITGPNGSGKSTILYGLASAFEEEDNINNHHGKGNFFYKRFRYFNGVKKQDLQETTNGLPVSEAIIQTDINTEPIRIFGCKNCNPWVHIEREVDGKMFEFKHCSITVAELRLSYQSHQLNSYFKIYRIKVFIF